MIEPNTTYDRLRCTAPRCIAIQPITRHIAIVDFEEMSIRVFSSAPQLSLLYTIGRNKSNSSSLLASNPNAHVGSFDKPYSAAYQQSGVMVAVEWGGKRGQLFDPVGRYLRWFGPFGEPWSVAMHQNPLNRSPSSPLSPIIVVADTTRDRLSVWSADASQNISQVLLKQQPWGVCVDMNGYVVVSCCPDQVKVLEPRKSYAEVEVLPVSFAYPAGTSVDDENCLMICEYSRHSLHFFEAAN